MAYHHHYYGDPELFGVYHCARGHSAKLVATFRSMEAARAEAGQRRTARESTDHTFVALPVPSVD